MPSHSERNKASVSEAGGKSIRWPSGLSLILHAAAITGLLAVHHGLKPGANAGSIELVMVAAEPGHPPEAGPAPAASAPTTAAEQALGREPLPEQPADPPQPTVVPRVPVPPQQATLPPQQAVPGPGPEMVPQQAVPQQERATVAPPKAVPEQEPAMVSQPPTVPRQEPTIAPHPPPHEHKPLPAIASVPPETPPAPEPRPARTARSSAHPARATRVQAPPPRPEPAAMPRVAMTSSDASAASAGSGRSATAAQQQAQAAADPAWLAGVGAWLQAHRSYPQMARALGRQGTVVVQVTVDPSGHVVGFDLVRGSGSDSLDRAAEALMRNAQLPPFPPDMRLPRQSLTVPIHYQLD